MSPGAARFVDIAPWLAVAPFVFTFIWCLVGFGVSRLSGWAALARAYPAGETMTPNQRWSWQSAYMNLNTKYNGALTIVADAQAVHFSVFVLIRPGHGAFSVPWQELHTAIRHLLFIERVELTFTRVPGVTMLITPKLAERLAAASAGRLTLP